MGLELAMQVIVHNCKKDMDIGQRAHGDSHWWKTACSRPARSPSIYMQHFKKDVKINSVLRFDCGCCNL